MRVFLGAACLVLASGCAGQATFRFLKKPERLEPLGPVLEVAEVHDARPTGRRGSLLPALLPWVPSATLQMARPEEDARLDLDVRLGMRQALMQLASESRLFSQVVGDPGKIRVPGPVRVLTARVRELSVELSWTTANLGPVAPLLWCLAVPMGRITVAVEVELSLSNALGETLYETTLKESRSRWWGLYFNHDWRATLIEDLEPLLRHQWRRVVSGLETVIDKGR